MNGAAVFGVLSLVSGGLSFAALIVLAGVVAYQRKLRRDEALLEGTSGKERTDIASAILGYLHVPLDGLTREQRFQLALEQLRARNSLASRWLVGIVFLAVIFLAVAVVSIVRERGSSTSTGSATTTESVKQAPPATQPASELAKIAPTSAPPSTIGPPQKAVVVEALSAPASGSATTTKEEVPRAALATGRERDQAVRAFNEAMTRASQTQQDTIEDARLRQDSELRKAEAQRGAGQSIAVETQRRANEEGRRTGFDTGLAYGNDLAVVQERYQEAVSAAQRRFRDARTQADSVYARDVQAAKDNFWRATGDRMP